MKKMNKLIRNIKKNLSSEMAKNMMLKFEKYLSYGKN